MARITWLNNSSQPSGNSYTFPIDLDYIKRNERKRERKKEREMKGKCSEKLGRRCRTIERQQIDKKKEKI